MTTAKVGLGTDGFGSSYLVEDGRLVSATGPADSCTWLKNLPTSSSNAT